MLTTRDGTLQLQEEILLLALHDEKGTIATGTMYQHAIAGAILAELSLHERIEIAVSGKKKTVNVADRTPLGDALLDECLEAIRQDGKSRSLQTWVGRFAAIRRLKHRVAERLCDRGVLKEEEGTLLLVFSRTIYPERDPRPERRLIERLDAAVFGRSRELDPRTVVLVALADATCLLQKVFDKKKLKEQKGHIERIVKGELTAEATRKALQAVHAAIVVASVMPAVISASTSH